jgi:hypothetical protein
MADIFYYGSHHYYGSQHALPRGSDHGNSTPVAGLVYYFAAGTFNKLFNMYYAHLGESWAPSSLQRR